MHVLQHSQFLRNKNPDSLSTVLLFEGLNEHCASCVQHLLAAKPLA